MFGLALPVKVCEDSSHVGLAFGKMQASEGVANFFYYINFIVYTLLFTLSFTLNSILFPLYIAVYTANLQL